MYSVGNMVRFYPNVIANQVFVGKVIEVRAKTDQYIIEYEGSRFCVHDKFVIEKIYKCNDANMNDDLVKIIDKLASQLKNERDINISLEEVNDNLKEEYVVLHEAFTKSQEHIQLLQSKIVRCEKMSGVSCRSSFMEH